MSEHSLPPDPSSWPRDPFRLLGVAPGVSSRDLRKAYLRLIRSYKPEHAPDEFKRIRAAYESLLPFIKALEPSPDEVESRPEAWPAREPVEPEPVRPPEPPTFEWTRPEPEPWVRALEGEPEAAYRELVDRHERSRGSEDDYLQLYWLLNLFPTFDRARAGVDWLVRGLAARGTGSPRLLELLKREIAADSSLALGDRLVGFFRRRTPPSLALEVAEGRWKAARRAGRWPLIQADLHALRSWLPEADEAAWPRALIASAMSLSWGDAAEAAQAKALAREVETLATRLDDHSEALYQIEYIQIVRAGLERLGGRRGAYSKIDQLLELSWDEPSPESRARVRAYAGQIAQGPAVALGLFDEVFAIAPVILARLSTVLGGLESESFLFLGVAERAQVSTELERFLESHHWADYRTLRPDLLHFCLVEAVSPSIVSKKIAETPQFIMTGKSPLAHAIDEDWPLRHVYRACEVAWETPGRD